MEEVRLRRRMAPVPARFSPERHGRANECCLATSGELRADGHITPVDLTFTTGAEQVIAETPVVYIASS
jgi:hypothetical protein